jgi:hypothetical protein
MFVPYARRKSLIATQLLTPKLFISGFPMSPLGSDYIFTFAYAKGWDFVVALLLGLSN